MRLTLRIFLWMGAAFALVWIGHSLSVVDRRLGEIDRQLRGDQELLAGALRPALERTVRTESTEAARYLIATLDAQPSDRRLRWVELAPDAPAEMAPRDRAAAMRARHRDGPVTVLVEQPRERWMYTYVPLRGVGAEAMGILEVRRRLPTRAEIGARVIASEAVVTALLLGAALLGVVLLGGGLVGRPVSRLVDHARAVGRGELSRRLPDRRRDELGFLATAMNQMTEQLEASRAQAEREAEARVRAVRQLRHAERLAAVGQLSAGVAHEIGTPLNVVLGHAEAIQDELEDGPARSSADAIVRQVERIARILRGLMRFAGDRGPSVERVDLGEVARETTELLEVAARQAGVSFRVEADRGAYARADAGQIQQVLTNLLMNAIHASDAGDHIDVRCHRAGEGITLEVEDEGSGIPEDLIDHVFDPFVTTKDVGEGTGLGLSVSYGIVKEHGGSIEVRSAVGKGTTLTVHLPADDGEAAA